MQFYTPQQDRSDKRLEVLTDRLLASMIIGVELMIITALVVVILDEFDIELVMEAAQIIGFAALCLPSVVWGVRHFEELMAVVQKYD